MPRTIRYLVSKIRLDLLSTFCPTKPKLVHSAREKENCSTDASLSLSIQPASHESFFVVDHDIRDEDCERLFKHRHKLVTAYLYIIMLFVNEKNLNSTWWFEENKIIVSRMSKSMTRVVLYGALKRAVWYRELYREFTSDKTKHPCRFFLYRVTLSVQNLKMNVSTVQTLK